MKSTFDVADDLFSLQLGLGKKKQKKQKKL